MRKMRIGLKGFGEIPRHLFRMMADDDMFEVVAISEYSRPEILGYLLSAETKGKFKVSWDKNFLIYNDKKARVVSGGEAGQVPWDVFDIDFVIDGTWNHRSRHQMEKHLDAGAKRVMLTTIPLDDVDRVVIRGVNDKTISSSDRLISPGSATTNIGALMLKILSDNFGVDYAMLTAVHSYTSDQPLRDRAGSDFRRSRSAAENIIPLETDSPKWIGQVIPSLKGKLEGTIVNVPVPNGSMLDMTTVLKERVELEEIKQTMRNFEKSNADIFRVETDPIVSTDVIDKPYSAVFDEKAMMMSPGRMIKTISWYHSAYAIACRIKELLLAYYELDKKGGAK